ncbi:MAG: 7-carboxy-7-deazaguanine synthase QueE [Candidatus Omnitrophica bacterium]|nr:7-carboxy-7-deazaguanine synthase QueE [Candidatus Omnitrophota bacterium]
MSESAKISEIFVSYQGEGPYAGSRQLFVRFFGCNMSCAYCDTKPSGYRSFTKNGLIGHMLNFDDNYNELVLTGGEPLLYPDFIVELLSLFKRYRKNDIFLETNGTLVKELELVLGSVDIVSMDFKLPSSTGDDVYWDEHSRFAAAAERKKLIVKAVVTGKTSMSDIKQMGGILKGLTKVPSVVIQPVSSESDAVTPADPEMLSYFKKYLEKELDSSILVLGQMHKCFSIK